MARSRGHAAAVAFLESAIASKASSKVACCAPSDTRECANCSAPEGRNGIVLRPCSRCKLAHYCSPACQSQHWEKGNHKKTCIPLSERSVASAKAAQGASSTGPLQVDMCAICFEPLLASTKRLSCGHVLHSKCADDLGNFSFGASHMCPICRKKI